MPSRRLPHQGSQRYFEHGERLAQFMGRNANELVFAIFHLFEQTDILMDHQGQWLSIARWRADSRLVWDAQAPPVGRGQWHGVDQDRQARASWLATDLLLLQYGFDRQQRSHGGPGFRGDSASRCLDNANGVLLQERAHRLSNRPLRSPATRCRVIGQYQPGLAYLVVPPYGVILPIVC